MRNTIRKNENKLFDRKKLLTRRKKIRCSRRR